MCFEKPLQYCKLICLQLKFKKKKERKLYVNSKKKKKKNSALSDGLYLVIRKECLMTKMQMEDIREQL